jgi:hypothetical protein
MGNLRKKTPWGISSTWEKPWGVGKFFNSEGNALPFLGTIRYTGGNTLWHPRLNGPKIV